MEPNDADLESASAREQTDSCPIASRGRGESKTKAWRRIFNSHRRLASNEPQHILLALFMFVVLLAAGVAIATVFANTQKNQMELDALTLARETGLFFSQHLDQAILPLFTLAQFVNEIESFRSLPRQIGLAGDEGSLPLLPPKVEGEMPTHRNVTGVCDDPSLQEQFYRIAGAIKRDSALDGILVNLQLVPDGTVCLLHPVNNTEDFPPGVYMDNTGAIGHDLLNDPARKFIAEATVPSNNVVIAGPLRLKQCQDCDPIVEKAFIARLPIKSETNFIPVNGEQYARWGFAVALINWNELVQRSGVYEIFQDEGMEFQLTRTDTKADTLEKKVRTCHRHRIVILLVTSAH
jgi:sensor domain CHASE-containing protein